MALAVASQADDPFGFVERAMAAFDQWLEADPEQSPEAVTDRRIAELLEEAA